ERTVQGGAQRTLGVGDYACRLRRDLTGHAAGRVLELIAGDDTVEQPEPLAALGVHQTAREDGFGSYGEAGELREKVGAAPVGVETDAREGEAQRCRLARDADVARKGEACTGARSGPVDRR